MAIADGRLTAALRLSPESGRWQKQSRRSCGRRRLGGLPAGSARARVGYNRSTSGLTRRPGSARARSGRQCRCGAGVSAGLTAQRDGIATLRSPGAGGAGGIVAGGQEVSGGVAMVALLGGWGVVWFGVVGVVWWKAGWHRVVSIRPVWYATIFPYFFGYSGCLAAS